MTDDAPLNRSRQLDLFRPEQAEPVTVIGVGGIGSPIVQLLAKMGVPDITAIDFDTVEWHNLPSQFYRKEDVGKPKVEALAEIVRSFSDCELTAVNERYVDQPLSGAIIAAVDGMDARRLVWERAKWNPNVDLYVDTRMGGEVFHILPVRPCDPDDVEFYEKHLFPSDQAVKIPCTAQAIVYNTFGIASAVCAILRRWWTEGELPKSFRGDFGSLTFL